MASLECARGAACDGLYQADSRLYKQVVVNSKSGVCQRTFPRGPKTGPARFLLCLVCTEIHAGEYGVCAYCHSALYDVSPFELCSLCTEINK
jgi:hypothetical protein